MASARAILGVRSDEQVIRWLKHTGKGVETGVIDVKTLAWGERLVASDWRFLTTTQCWLWLSVLLVSLWLLWKLTLLILS